jgi:ubiquinone/menaquinone biosynthesis C-methylase UbiE
MPDFREIYAHEAERYHRLVSAEDHRGELPRALARVARLDGARVIEVGMGTGRVTKLLLEAGASVEGYEPSAAMLEVARQHLGDRFRAVQADVREVALPRGAADVALAGWALGHFCEWYAPRYLSEIGAVIEKLTGALAAGGTLIVIETLGTGSDRPGAPNAALATYYAWLESELGMQREELRTDYRFESAAAAVEALEFFFGPELSERVRASGSGIVPEWTGLWWKKL